MTEALVLDFGFWRGVQIKPAPDNKFLTVSVIKIGKNLIEKVLPQFDDLRLLSHVRAVNADKTEKAVIVCNRLPKMDCKNILHLVSFENCFNGPKNLYSNTQFPGVTGDFTTLVSLKSWSFFCNDHFIITKEAIA